MLRFVVDESSWHLEGHSSTAVENALEMLLERIETIGSRGEEAAIYSGFYDFDDVTPHPYQVLFEPNSLVSNPDLLNRVRTALDKLPNWDDRYAEVGLDLDVAGSKVMAPSIALAHSRIGGGEVVACLPLHTAGRYGPLSVTLVEQVETVHFVTDDSAHRAFFRDALLVEKGDVGTYAALATSAFPDLRWADGVWGGLRDFSRPFCELRADVTSHLAVLDDHGIEFCREAQPRERAARFGSKGVTASGENGKTRRNRDARRDRTRTWRGAEHQFWWHTKIQPNIDRIHFLYSRDEDCIVVGLFKDHCYLPG